MSHGPPLSHANAMAIDPAAMSLQNMPVGQLPTGLAGQQLDGPDSALMMEANMLDNFDLALDRAPTFDEGDKTYGAMPANMAAIDTGPMEDELQGDVQMSGVGAGPLPTGYGNQTLTMNGANALSDFTKRRNWSQRVVEELKDMLHILTPDGQIIYVSPSGKQLTGFAPDDLVGKFIVDFIHPDDSGIFVREFNESIASGQHLRFYYRFRKQDGTYVIFESHGHPHLSPDPSSFGSSNAMGICRGFFIMARPYPTKNALLLDSMLEHKIENERLRKRIADLKREEAEDAEEVQRGWSKSREGRSEVTASDDTASVSVSTGILAHPDSLAMPPPAKPAVKDSALTQQNLEDVNANMRPDSINDKMARYEGASHIETIEMLTGLRYQDGERSKGISTGDVSPALIRGDAGIIIPAEKEVRSADKKKKTKVVDEYVCTDCGTLDSPEWRKGPNGPKTLCNACGLRWAKKEKKRTSKVSAQHIG